MGEGLSLGQLQAFLTVARLGNVTKSAEELFLTQPALTSRLKRLEQEVGAILLLRDHRGARLSEAGAAFLPYAEEVVERLQAAEVALGQLKRAPGRELVLATTQTMNVYVLPSAVHHFVAANPTVHLRIVTAPSEQVLELVVAGEVDLGIGRSLHHPDIENSPLYEEDYALAVLPDHRLLEREELTLPDLVGETLVTMFRSSNLSGQLRDDLRRLGGATFVDLDNPEAAKRVAAEAGGIALLPLTAVMRELRDRELVALPVTGLPPLRRTMVAYRRRAAASVDLAETFLRHVRADLIDSGLAEGTARIERFGGGARL